MTRVVEARDEDLARSLASDFGGSEDDGSLAVAALLPRIPPERGESWHIYKSRVAEDLESLATNMSRIVGAPVEPLFASNALQMSARVEQIEAIATMARFELIELDPLVQVTTMDDAILDTELPLLRSRKPHLTGRGVTVAVLDSGIDLEHPALQVDRSFETCGEDVRIPGDHGTHCAGSIASRDAVYAGIAPEVRLVNVKVLRANGTGRETFITLGIDRALDAGADVLSMSLGFNHLPTWSNGGHGWSCPDGRCVLCRAVETAVVADGRFVVVAAGNEHERAEALRAMGMGDRFDTEISCPGHSPHALTVGAVHKSTFVPAAFSSRGPTAFGSPKPDVVAPGVNIRSTVPVPRDPSGRPVPNPARSLLFDRKSGTSMATPIVAGAAALIVQELGAGGTAWTPADVRRALLTRATSPLPYPPSEVGQGRISLRHF